MHEFDKCLPKGKIARLYQVQFMCIEFTVPIYLKVYYNTSLRVLIRSQGSNVNKVPSGNQPLRFYENLKR